MGTLNLWPISEASMLRLEAQGVDWFHNGGAMRLQLPEQC